MTPRDAATQAQVDAAQPTTSTWLAANAGSGKTRVLTDRVARLLLEGVEPQHILCLTYTKAAASEMQNRLFKRLGAWAMLDENALIDALHELGIQGAVTDKRLRAARTLFARAIETPGGLKIQTIHSFCASLLRRFPLEAKVSPQFTEIEDRAADLLRAEIVDEMAEDENAEVIADLAQHYTGEDFNKLTQAIVRLRDGFQEPLDWAGCLALFGAPTDLSETSIEASTFTGGEAALLNQIIPPMLAKGGNDEKAAIKLRSLGQLGMHSLPVLENVFLTGAKAKEPFSAKTGTLPTKATQQLLADVMPTLDAFMHRVEAARPARLALQAARKTQALHRFAARFLPRYEKAKTQRGWLDFDDLIDRARTLLSDEKVAAWVLWRIDGGIDHILVDEAQDTSPAQWDVIRKLAAEFTSGQGVRTDDPRTIFVVGDKKQSIYSFQGADPRQFDAMRDEFEGKLADAQMAFQTRALAYSFRSAQAVLDLVDRTFQAHIEAGFGKEDRHIAFKNAMPGRVDLWPIEPPQPAGDETPWYQPLDRRAAHDPVVMLAERIAIQIDEMVNGPALIPDADETGNQFMRPVRAGDFLILVQTRGPLFSEIIRAIKAKGLPIAGADRLKVGGELAVRDLAALLSFLAVPDDSLSLACALRSPLFGWSEQSLFDLAHRRNQDHLWQAIRARDAEFPETMAILNDLRRNIDFLRPYDLIERILTRHGGRRRLLARLGTEAEDGINALLSQALAYERNSVPSLTGFLSWMETDALEIKRQIDSSSDQVRVMTVHGAKGLEAPIVVLPDCGKRLNSVKDDVVTIDGKPAWKTAVYDAPASMAQSLARIKDAQDEERLRLLYVALTRAEKWLIVTAAGDLGADGSTWYQMIDAALDAEGARSTTIGGMEVKRLQQGDWTAAAGIAIDPKSDVKEPLETYFDQTAPKPPDRPKSISPSDLGGPKALPGEAGRTEEAAKAYGTLVHRLLEQFSVTPRAAWKEIARATYEPECSAEDHIEAANEAQRVLNNTGMATVFDANSFAEIPLTADLGGRPLYGVVDRLVVSDTTVLAVDFKTNRTVPARAEDCPEGLLRQMGAYAHALCQIYPDKNIEVAILWTHTAQLMRLPHEIVMRALEDTPYLDGGPMAT